jgi:hypothetical protein
VAHDEEFEMLIAAQLDSNFSHGMGRLYSPDERDTQFPMTAHLETVDPATLPTSRYCIPGPILNQGSTPMCVDYASNQWLATTPIRNARLAPGVIYCEAQKLDPWPGDCTNHQYDGTSVRAAAQYLQSVGYIDTYVWAFNADTVATWILSGKGPVIFGTRWYQGMFSPDADGVVHVNPNDAVAGGHAYLCIGYNSKTRMFRFVNSWGIGWAQRGRFWMNFDDADILIKQQGECMTASERKLVVAS